MSATNTATYNRISRKGKACLLWPRQRQAAERLRRNGQTVGAETLALYKCVVSAQGTRAKWVYPTWADSVSEAKAKNIRSKQPSSDSKRQTIFCLFSAVLGGRLSLCSARMPEPFLEFLKGETTGKGWESDFRRVSQERNEQRNDRAKNQNRKLSFLGFTKIMKIVC